MKITLTRDVAIKGVHHHAGLDIEIGDLDGARLIGMEKAFLTDPAEPSGGLTTETAGELVEGKQADDEVETVVVNASDEAIALATKKGLDITTVEGSGTEGTITVGDVKQAVKAAKKAAK